MTIATRPLGQTRTDVSVLLLEPPAGATPPFPHDYSAGNIRAGLEQSLRRLGTDRLDLVQVHMSPSRAQMEAGQTVETLRSLRDEITAAAEAGAGTLIRGGPPAGPRPRTKTGAGGRSGCPGARASAAGSPRASRTCWAT